LLTLGVLVASGCSKPAPTINASMTQVMQPQAQTIWDITSKAFNDKGDGLEASKISQADWDQLAKAGAKMRDRALVLAKARHVTVTSADETIMGQAASRNVGSDQVRTWDAANPKQIQAWIDADPGLFAQRAQILAQAGDDVVKASRTKDVSTLYRVSAGLDEVCDGCHQKFWGTDDPPPFPH
jgi:hypothetical protein